MANIGKMLGMLLATRMAGRGRYGSALGTAGLIRGGLARKAGLAGLGYMAWRAYQDSKAGRPQGQAGDPAAPRHAAEAEDQGGHGATATGGLGGALGSIVDSLTGGQMQRRKGEPGLGDRVRSYFDPGSAEAARDPGSAEAAEGAGGDAAAPPEAAEIDDDRALLLIRAMIAAANADGHISPDERQRILAQVDEAGGDAEDHRLIEQELERPKPLDTLLAEIDDHETARQFYAASRTAMRGETPTHASYLEYLRNRLDLPPDETSEIDEAMQ